MGKRNVWCAEYAMCLDQAITRGHSFNCRGCSREYERLKEGDENLLGCYLLLAAVFRPDALEAYWRDRQLAELEERRSIWG